MVRWQSVDSLAAGLFGWRLYMSAFRQRFECIVDNFHSGCMIARRWRPQCAHDVHTNLSTINPQILCSQFPPVIIHYSHIWLLTLHVVRELTLNAGLTAAQHWRYRLHIRLDSPTLAEPANSETHCLVKLLYWTPVLYQGNWIGRGSTIQVPSYCCTTFALL